MSSKNRFKTIRVRARNTLQRTYRRAVAFVDSHPFTFLFIIFAIFLGIILLGNTLRREETQKTVTQTKTKEVSVYRIGSVPRIHVQAQVEKSGVVTITSLSQGVVQNLHVREGSAIDKGSPLVNLSTNFQGGNALSTQRQIAGKQYELAKSTYPDQIELIEKQRKQAKKTETQAEELRDITEKSIGDTQAIINLNNEILTQLDKNIAQLESTNTNGSNDQAILSAKQLKSQFLSANNQLNQSLRTNQYNSGDDNTPAELAELTRDITLKQLEIQEKTQTLNLEITKLQLQLARVNEATMFPSSPFRGTVQRVFVKIGQVVNPGTPLLLIAQAQEEDPIVAIAYVPKSIRDSMSNLEPSVLQLDNITYETYPSFISQEAINGTLYGIFFPIPDAYTSKVTEKGYIEVNIPVGKTDTTASIPFIPIDAIYQTQEQTYVFVVKNNTAQARPVTLGPIYGSYVQIASGLTNGDVIILDRTVVAGDKLTIQNTH